jgi:hypothetical protein
MDEHSFPLPVLPKKDSEPPISDEDFSSDDASSAKDDASSDEQFDRREAPPIDKSVLIFYVEFSNGYTFRQFVEFSKRVSKQLPLAFSQKGITTAICSSTRQMIVNSVFRREDLTRFEVNRAFVNIPAEGSEWFHIVNLDTGELFDQIRAVAKKDGVRLMQRADRPESIQIQIFGPKTDGGTSNIRVKKYSPISYTVTEPNRRPSTCPNVTVQLARFCSCLSGLIKARYSKVAVRIFASGVTVLGATATGSSTRGATFGTVPTGISPTGQTIGESPETDDSEFCQISLASPTVNSLVKLINFHSEGVIRIYCSSPSVVRIETSLGCYGSIRIYLGGTRQDSSQSASSAKGQKKERDEVRPKISDSSSHTTRSRIKRMDETSVIDLRK